MANLSKFTAGDTTAVKTKADTWVDALNGIGGTLLDSGHLYQGADTAGVDAPYHRAKDTGASGIDYRILNDAGVVVFQLNTGTEGSPTWATTFTFDLTNRKLSVGDAASTTAAALHILDGGSDNKPGLLVLYDDAGADYYLWVDTAGNLRMHTSAPADDDADGSVITSAGTSLAGMYMYEAAFAQVIDSTQKYHLVQNFSSGTLSGWTFGAGKTGPIASFANYGGTVPGTVRANDVGHGLVTGDIVSITGATSASHNVVAAITKIDNDSFYYTATWGADSTGTWTEGSYLQAGANAAGIYLATFTMSCSVAVASKVLHFEIFQNAIGIDKISAEMTPGSTSTQNCSASGFITVAANDRIFLAAENYTDATDLTLQHANVVLHRV